jgi:hypothetical protein
MRSRMWLAIIGKPLTFYVTILEIVAIRYIVTISNEEFKVQ